jgi:uncharacterized protein (TIGR03663 family)
MDDERHSGQGPEGKKRESHEVIAWILIVGVALAMRVAQLGTAPLSAGEARRATLAWLAATGQGMPAAGYEPLVFAANSLLFMLVGANDALARLWPALFGSALVLTPVLLRRHLGRVGALASGLYLAFSPTVLLASRQLDGTAMAAAGVMVFVGALSQFLRTERRGCLLLAGVGLAVAVSAGSTVYGLLLPLALAWVGISQLGSDCHASRAARHIARLKPHASQFFLIIALSVVAFSTGLGWNVSGVGAVGSVMVDWLRRFEAAEVQTASPLILLAVYELAGVVLGLGGLVWAVRREQYWAALIGLWAGLGILLLAVMPGRKPTDLIWVVLPLAMLFGLAVQAIAHGHWSTRARMRAAYGVLVLVLWIQAYLMVARYAAYGDGADLAIVAVVVGLQVFLGLSFGFVLGFEGTVRTAGAATGAVLMALMVSAAWGVAYRRPNDPREALVHQPTAANVRDLVSTLRTLSWEQTGMPSTLEFVYEAPSESILAWYFRDFEMARRVERLGELDLEEMGPTVVTMRERAVVDPDPLTTGYLGQDFSLRRQWELSSMACRFWKPGCSIAFDWFLFRDGPALPEADWEATLWRQAPLGDRET